MRINPTRTILGPVAVIDQLKKQAKLLVKSRGIKHHEALDLIAQRIGKPNWKFLLECVEPFQATEEAFRHGLVIAMDAKEGTDLLEAESDVFVEDPAIILLAVQDKELRKTYKEILRVDLEMADEPRKIQDYSVTEFDREFLGFLDELLYFRLNPKFTVPEDFNGVIDLVEPHCFWEPSFAWIKGKFYEHP